MTETEKLKAQIQELQEKLQKLEEIEKQPRMNLQQEGEYAVVSYHDKTYYRLENKTTFSWYIKKDVSANHPVPTLVMVEDAETERLLEGIYYNHIQVKKEKEQRTKTPVEECYKDWWGIYPELENDTEYDVTRWQGFQAGYHFAYEEKVKETAQERGERLHKDVERVVKESVKWCEEHQNESVEDWLKPQTPEQVADGLKEAFREAVKQGVVSSVDKPQTLYDVIADWWDDVFTKKETSLQELVDAIEEWLPKEQSSAGSQNAYVECTVEGFNDAINKIRRKLR